VVGSGISNLQPSLVESAIGGSFGSERQQIETTLESSEVYRGEFLTAFQDRVELPDGTHALREYVRHPGAVMIVPLLEDEHGCTRLVLERQFRYPLNRTMLEFPAGKLDPGESTFNCAKRELREETGFTAREWAFAGVIHPVISYSTEFIEMWFARDLIPGDRCLDAGEFLDVLTGSSSELFQWAMDGTITDAKTICGVFWLQNLLSGVWKPSWEAHDPYA
jgi:ADP-ribose pyrophosphatase